MLTPDTQEVFAGRCDDLACTPAIMLVYAQFYRCGARPIIHVGRWRMSGSGPQMRRDMTQPCMAASEKQTLPPCSHL